MIKKVVIAAAGQGTRMLHLTKNKSKHLIRVQKKPFLAYLLDNLLKAGYKDIILVVGYREDLMKEFLEKYSPPHQNKKQLCKAEQQKNSFVWCGGEYKAKLVNQFEILGGKEKMYGTACPLMCAQDIIGKENFLFLFGDNLYSITDLKAMNIDDDYTYVAGLYHQHPEKYGVLLMDGQDFLEQHIEKPKTFVGNFINTGLYKFTPDIFKKISKIKKSPRGEYEITDALNILAKEKKVKVKKIQDYWLDFGNPGDIIKLFRFLKASKNFK